MTDRVARLASPDRLAFRCPGCGHEHVVSIGPGDTWGWNGSLEAPTLTPSVLVRSGHYVDGKHPCWCDYIKDHPGEISFGCGVCHSFVQDGQIQFLSDCTHALAGQTVPLPILPPAPEPTP